MLTCAARLGKAPVPSSCFDHLDCVKKKKVTKEEDEKEKCGKCVECRSVDCGEAAACVSVRGCALKDVSIWFEFKPFWLCGKRKVTKQGKKSQEN